LLFAALPTEQQTKVFDPAPPGTRKIILATNIAETSITIRGVRYVVDTGKCKIRKFNAKIGMESLSIENISKNSADQRMGRAGREVNNKSFFAEIFIIEMNLLSIIFTF